MSHYNAVNFRRIFTISSIRLLFILTVAMSMVPSAFAECGCQDGIDISLTGNIPGFKVKGAGKGYAPAINVELKPDVEYEFTLKKDTGNLGNTCMFGTVELECGLEYQIQYSDGTVSQFMPGRRIAVTANNTTVSPSSFRLRLTSSETQTPHQNGEGEETEGSWSGGLGGGGGGTDPEVPAKETYPKIDPDTGLPIKPGLMISIPLNTIGMGPGFSAPFRSAGYLICGGQVNSTLLSEPSQLTYSASEELTGRTNSSEPNATIWGPETDPILIYATPAGYAQERHIATPTRLFRVTGFVSNKDTIADFVGAPNTYVREYLRGTPTESASVTLANAPVSWWTIVSVTDGVKVTQSVSGVVKSKTFTSSSAESLIVDHGQRTTHVILVAPTTTGGDYTIEIEKTVSGTTVENQQQVFKLVDESYQIKESTKFPTVGSTLTTEYYYYPESAGNSAGRLWFTRFPSGAWEVFEYTGVSGSVQYSPFASEAIVDTEHSNPATLPLTPATGLTDSSARIRKKIISSSGTEERVVSLADATLPNAGVVVREESDSDSSFIVTNTATDSITDGILLEGNGDTISYSYQIASDSSNRWLAGLPLLTAGTDGKATLYEYQLAAGIFTTTETTGFARDAEETEVATVDDQLFQVVAHLSERIVTARGPEGIISRETLYNTGTSFSRGRLEEFFYLNGRYHRTVVDGIETRRVDWLDRFTKVEKDAAGLVQTVKYNESGEVIWSETGAGGGVPAIRTTYEVSGLTTTTRVGGVISSIAVKDAAGRIISIQDQSGTVTQYTYPNNGRDRQSTLPGGIVKLEENYLDGSPRSRSGAGWVAEFYSTEVLPGFEGYQEARSAGSATGHTDRKIVDYIGSNGKLIKTVSPSPAPEERSINRTYNYVNDQLFSVSSTESEWVTDSSDPENVYSYDSVTATLPTESYYSSYLSVYDPAVVLGGEIVQGQDFDSDGELIMGTDRFIRKEIGYELINGVVCRKTTEYRYPDISGDNPLIKESVDSIGFVKVGSNSYSNTQIVTEKPSMRSLTRTSVTTPSTATIVVTDNDSATTTSVDVQTTEINGYTQSVAKAGGATTETFGYDAFGRINRYTNPRSALTLSYYDGRFLLSGVANQLNQITKYTYYSPSEKNSGRLKTVTSPGNVVETTSYNDRGQVTLVSGSNSYPKSFDYDEYGDRTTLTTFATSLTPSVTRWKYQLRTGLLESKRFDDLHKTAETYDFIYTYSPDAKMATRTTGKGITTTYTYDDFTRDLKAIEYSGDSNLTPDVTFSDFDGFGRPGHVVEARTGGVGSVGTDASTGYADYNTEHSLVYDSSSGEVSTVNASNHRWLKNVKVMQLPNSLGRPKGFNLQTGSPSSTLSSQSYSYDPATSRLQEVSSPQLVSALSLLAGPETLQGVSVSVGGNVVHSRALSVDLLGRTVGVRNLAGTSLAALTSIASIGHKFDAAGRKETARREDGSVWSYAYSSHSEISTAVKTTAAGNPIPTLDFGYTYDDIGNRKTSKSGTAFPSVSSGISSRGYGQNLLNQYNEITHDGKVNVLARSNTSIVANTPTGANHNGIDNQDNLYGVRQTANLFDNGRLVTTILKRTGETATQNILTWVSPASFSPTYDLDGNLTWDGRWNYIWDGENRLVSATSAANATSAGAPNIIVKYAYDWQGRMIGRSLTQGGSTTHKSFAYDGWNMIAEWSLLDLAAVPAGGNLLRTHLWGPDIASSARASFGIQPDYQSAGGVGGLIATTRHSGSTKTHYIPSYDANGNVLAWSNGNGDVIQKRDYDPFGNIVLLENLASDLIGELPSFGFSTKVLDEATGLHYYGNRYYDGPTGRWTSRDPIQEEGGVNLYGFLGNDGVNFYDVLGYGATKPARKPDGNEVPFGKVGRFTESYAIESIKVIGCKLEFKAEGWSQLHFKAGVDKKAGSPSLEEEEGKHREIFEKAVGTFMKQANPYEKTYPTEKCAGTAKDVVMATYKMFRAYLKYEEVAYELTTRTSNASDVRAEMAVVRQEVDEAKQGLADSKEKHQKCQEKED